MRFRESIPISLVAVASLAIAAFTRSFFWVAPAGVAIVYLLVRAYRLSLQKLEHERRQAQRMSELHMATIEALALAIDAKDQTAQNHVRRVQQYAVQLARVLRVSESELLGIRTAALLHDIGKLAVPEHILTKPGQLTSEEWQKVRIHPQVGADIIAAVPFPYPVAPLVLSHHERWDGRGYPAGLKQEEIPLGARILSVADYYDSLTSERSYRGAVSSDAALALLRQEAGKALDPAVVDAFTTLLPHIREEVSTTEIDMPKQALAAARRATSSSIKTSVLDDIALAHREIYSLYQVAQTMGTSLGVADTMTLISSKLAALVPFSACALFLQGDEAQSLRCQFATGSDAELLSELAIPHGQGLAGWVVKNQRPLVNGRPSAEIDAGGRHAATSLQSALVCPLLIGQKVIGAVALYHTEASFYRDDHRRLLDRVCEQAGPVIHNAIVFERTQEDSLTDPLTGLPNTRFMFMHLTRELARAERLKSEISLLVMDVDEFKEINDTYGHHVGDRALREVARMLRTAIRPYDICVRYAGDEFIVVLSGCGSDEAEHKRVELQQVLDTTVVDTGRETPLTVGISIGAAVFPHDGGTYEALLAKADERMYVDKSMRKRTRVERQSIA